MPAFSGLFDYITPGGHTLIQKVTPAEKRINRALNSGRGGRRLRNVLLALTGSPVGQSKVLASTRIKASEGGDFGFGGRRTIEPVTYQAGVTTAADLARADANIGRRTRPTTYPVDRSITRNGLFGRNV